MKQVPLYDALAADYDRFVKWGGRLAHELPFFVRLFDGWPLEGQGVQRVLDAACGTGHHAIALAQRGYEVVGADLSAAMVQRARENAAVARAKAEFVVAGLGRLASLGRTFDAVLCLGNSLPHLLTVEAVTEALADFAAVLHPDGLLVLQNRNFDLVWAKQERFTGPQAHRKGDDEWLFVRFYDFHEKMITFNMVCLRRTEEGWQQHVEATELRPIFGDDLTGALAAAGFADVSFYGGYDGAAFDPAQSSDLIAVARRT